MWCTVHVAVVVGGIPLLVGRIAMGIFSTLRVVVLCHRSFSACAEDLSRANIERKSTLVGGVGQTMRVAGEMSRRRAG
jgi:hypothetical protein